MSPLLRIRLTFHISIITYFTRKVELSYMQNFIFSKNYIFSESSVNYLLNDKTFSPKNFQRIKTYCKVNLFSFREPQIITVLFEIRNSNMS